MLYHVKKKRQKAMTNHRSAHDGPSESVENDCEAGAASHRAVPDGCEAGSRV